MANKLKWIVYSFVLYSVPAAGRLATQLACRS